MKLTKVVVALGLAGAAFAASAQTATGTINVSATVPGACTLTANALTFGQYNSGADKDFTNTIDFNCTTSASSAISLGYSAWATGAQRRMNLGGAGGSFMNYVIYQPSTAVAGAACAYTNAWGNGTTGGTVLTTGVGTAGTSRSFNVCGRIPAGQTTLPAGNYVDTVAVTATL